MTTVALGIDQLSRPQPGGTATYVRGLIHGLAEIAPNLTLVGVGPRDAPAVPGLSRVVRVPLPVRALTPLWARSDLGFPRAAVWHATSLAGPLGRSRAARRTLLVHDLLWRDVPTLFTPRGVAFHEANYQRLKRHEATTALVTSEATAARLLDDGFHPERVAVIRLGVNASVTPDDERAKALLTAAGVEGPFFLVVGTVEPRKNLARLAAAVRQSPELPPVVVVGPQGWSRENLTGLVLLGPQDAAVLAALRASARAHVFVPLAEGWGLPAVEALAAGRPLLVSSTVPSTPSASDARRVDPTDLDALVVGLHEVLAIDDSTTARAARVASTATLTWAACARDHLAVWQCA